MDKPPYVRQTRSINSHGAPTGAATIRALTEETGCTIDIGEDGTITIASTDGWTTLRRLRSQGLSDAPAAIVSANAFDKGLENDLGVEADGVKLRKTLQEARADAALDRPVRENGEQMTRRRWVERKVAEGLKTKVTQEDRIKPMSRMAYFRANNEEQRAHDRKVKEAGKKDVFWIGDYEVTKTEHDYAKRYRWLRYGDNDERSMYGSPWPGGVA